MATTRNHRESLQPDVTLSCVPGDSLSVAYARGCLRMSHFPSGFPNDKHTKSKRAQSVGSSRSNRQITRDREQKHQTATEMTIARSKFTPATFSLASRLPTAIWNHEYDPWMRHSSGYVAELLQAAHVDGGLPNGFERYDQS